MLMCAAFFLFVFLRSFDTHAAAPRHILFLYAHTEEFPAHKLFEKGFKQHILSSGETVEYSYMYLELNRYAADPDYPAKVQTFLKQKYALKQPDLVVTHLGPAADFAIKYGRGIFPKAEFMLTADEPEGIADSELPAGFGGVTGTFNVHETVRVIQKLQPDIKKIYVVIGDSEREKRTIRAFRQDVAEFAKQMEFEYLNTLPFEKMLQTLEKATGDTAVIYVFVFRDAAGRNFVPANEVQTFSRASRVPVYVPFAVFMGRGAIGGYVMSTEVLGMRAAEFGLARLHMQGGPTVPVMVQNVEYQFDWRELRRWKIDERSLPAESRILYKELSAWEQYRGIIVGGVLLIIFQAALAIGLMVNRAMRRKAEKDLIELNADLEDKVHVRTVALSIANEDLRHEMERRRKSEEALRMSEGRYRAMMEQSSDAMALVDMETKHFIEVNDCWTKMFGYTSEEAGSLKAYDVIVDSPENIDRGYEEIIKAGGDVTCLHRFRRKDGLIFEAERSATFIRYAGKTVLMFANRDLSAERKLQEKILRDVRLAADVQKALLPEGFDDLLVKMRVIYRPYHIVSGDFYDYAWSQDHQKFAGFILDVSGHGVSSSLQGIAVSTYFRDILDAPMTLDAKLRWINDRVLRYFTDETFAAAVYFELDFSRQTIRFATAGVYGFLASSSALPRVVMKEGSLVGVTATPEYNEWTMPIKEGEKFYFMTDGLFEQVHAAGAPDIGNFEKGIAWLRSLAEGQNTKDDCCALCICINETVSFPVRLDYHRYGEYGRIRRRLHDLLKEKAGDHAERICVVLGEALNNAARESMDVSVKLNRFGSRLIIRVKDGGGGFDGNSRVMEFARSDNADAFEERLYFEGGRGILIMVSWMDRVIYNRKGNEVLLVKRLT